MLVCSHLKPIDVLELLGCSTINIYSYQRYIRFLFYSYCLFFFICYFCPSPETSWVTGSYSIIKHFTEFISETYAWMLHFSLRIFSHKLSPALMTNITGSLLAIFFSMSCVIFLYKRNTFALNCFPTFCYRNSAKLPYFVFFNTLMLINTLKNICEQRNITLYVFTVYECKSDELLITALEVQKKR